ncbi:zinc-dependent alcohol dehydrogenase [Inquilinus limosus]|uniref:zinc-dependent alcohol dehydrogenase n=1 Tax=Inquilinus limosus TaxID=171674 RepID=UPI00040AD057|nr:alcohol dehydrogenase catalytic domain-containing protein [Inquilinus limosus]
MQAAFLHGIRDIRLGDLESPLREPGDVLLTVSAVGLCGSDLHYYLEGGIGAAQVRRPFVPGHEFAARLAEDRPDLGLAAGQLVAVDPARPCGHCEWCRRGHHNLCPDTVFAGAPPQNGALTEQITARPDQIFAVPERFTPTQTVMLEPLGVCIHAIDLAKPRLLETVALLGCGPIGLGVLQLLKLSGVGRIWAIDPLDYRAALAGRLGADATAPSYQAVLDDTDGRGADLVIEATNAPEGFQHAAEAAAIGGRVVLVGIPEGDRYTVEASLIRRKGLKIKTSRRMGSVYPRAIALVAGGRVDVDALVSHHFDLDQTAEAFAMQADYRDHAMKSIVHPNGRENRPAGTGRA